MIIKNPTNEKIGMVYLGTEFEIEPKGELKNVPAEVAVHWKSRVHKFIEVFEDIKEIVKDVKELKADVSEVVASAKADVAEVKNEVTKVVGKVIKK